MNAPDFTFEDDMMAAFALLDEDFSQPVPSLEFSETAPHSEREAA